LIIFPFSIYEKSSVSFFSRFYDSSFFPNTSERTVLFFLDFFFCAELIEVFLEAFSLFFPAEFLRALFSQFTDRATFLSLVPPIWFFYAEFSDFMPSFLVQMFFSIFLET